MHARWMIIIMLPHYPAWLTSRARILRAFVRGQPPVAVAVALDEVGRRYGRRLLAVSSIVDGPTYLPGVTSSLPTYLTST